MTKFNKYKLISIDENNEQNEKYYNSLKEISKDLNVEYFMIRALYQHSIKPKKYLHSNQHYLSQKYKILNI
jgi:hypothetical protein